MAPPPLVSSVLPTFDRLAYLREAVASVLAQTFGDWELLLVDDGSTDGSAEWARGLRDRRVRVIELPHTGRIAAVRNHGLGVARGRWVAFLDSDDRWRADKLQAQLAAHAAEPGVRWSYTGRTLIDAAGATLPDAGFRPWRPVSGWITRPLLVHEAMIALPSVLVERSLLAEAGGFDESLVRTEDYDLWLRLSRRAPCLAVPLPLVAIRQHAASATHDRPETNESFMRVYARFAAEEPSRELRAVCRRQRAYYAWHLADQWRRQGRRGRALRTAARSVLLDPFSPRGWRTLGAALYH